MTFLLAALMTGCGAPGPRSGLLLSEHNQVLLVESTGRTSRLKLTGDAVALNEALGCRVEVSGSPLGRRFIVNRWKITDSGYGSEPFVGELLFTGSAWRIRDRNSQTLVELVVESMGKLREHEGDLVLVDGFVLGPNLVKVVSFRVLRDL